MNIPNQRPRIVRAFVPLVLALGVGLAVALGGCGRKQHWDMSDVHMVLADLHLFHMISADTGKPVRAADFRGKVVVLYFGYTHCPDVCPLTMSHLATAIDDLGPQGKDVRILFVSVDPARDTLPILKAYTHAFSAQAIGLRGTMAQVVDATKLYHVAFSYGKKDKYGNYVVNHSASIYVFDRQGKSMLIGSDLTRPAAIAHDLRQLLQG
jgi:protein SCO1/2